MKHTVSGASILLVIFLMTALSVAALSYVRTSGFLTSLALARQETEYQYWAAYGLMNYASATIRTQKDVCDEPILIHAWPTKNAPYQGVINTVVAGNQVIITVQLLKEKRVLKELAYKKALKPEFFA